MPSESDDFIFAGHERRRQRENRDRRDFGNRVRRERNDRSMIKIHINLGSSAGLLPKHIVGTVANEAGIPGKLIGKIEINERFSTFDVPRESAQAVIDVLNKTRIIGRRVTARLFSEQN